SFNNGSPYWRGHRGYRNYRDGYRRHNGYWFPRGAFIAPGFGPRFYDGRVYDRRVYERRIYRRPQVIELPFDHVRWCERRYRSYRLYDNSFQPNYGGRRACLSPYY
ncbi:MAG: BA14K family protein, partial [Rhizobiaceae bacterium]